MVGIACKFFITKYTSLAIPIGLAECHLTPSWSTYKLNNVWESFNELHHAKTVVFSGSPDKSEKQSSWCYVAKSFLEVRQIILKTANKFWFWSEKIRELRIPMTWNDKEIAFLCYWGQVLGEGLIERFFCQFFMDFFSVSAVCDIHQFLFYSELPCIFAKNHIFRIFSAQSFSWSWRNRFSLPR